MKNKQVPLVAIRGSVIFPKTDTLLSFSREKSVAAVDSAFAHDKVIAAFTQRDTRTQDPDITELYDIGTLAVITQMMSTKGEIHALVRGQKRVKLHEIVSSEPFLLGDISELTENNVVNAETEAMARRLTSLFKKLLSMGKQAEIMTVMRLVSGQATESELVDQIASLLDIKYSEKQRLLEDLSLNSRMTKVIEYLEHEVNVIDIENRISKKTHKKFEDQMRKAMLKEKKSVIEQELGEMGEEEALEAQEIAEYNKKIKAAKLPLEVKKKAKKELKRLSKLSVHSPEGGYIRNYLDWLVELPWSKLSTHKVSVKDADKVLEKRHYGMKKAKERILEYLSVMKLKEANGKKTNKQKGKKNKDKYSDNDQTHPTILCFIGPPGVGKTSIGKSIAEALDREFVRMSLGGVRDEAEIRGHRRTYVGALPGRIIQGIKTAGTRNPVFMLDEIDKLGTDFRGDPSSALLEALDPEQNKEFGDHYLEVPFDLSEVMFICTGNVLEDIPGPLRDRMEIISFPGYTQDEKYNIGKDFLWPKQVRIHGFEKKEIKIQKQALYEIIERYTREAGVRNLERNIGGVLRKMARLKAEKKKYPKSVKKTDVHKYLGPHKFSSQIAGKKDEVGMSTGLAVTAAGGEILFIEVSLMPGKGKLKLTGQLGDVMKESAKAAFTWARSHWTELGLREDFANGIDVHIHVPEGAVPKDGPSAGIAMTTALVSALTGVAVKRDVGMTGEVTLRGRVLPIGGVKEKVIAGHRAGLKTIILPLENKKDMVDVPDSTQKDVKFVFANRVDQVLKVALTKWPVVSKTKGKKQTTPLRPAFLTAAN